MEESVRKPGQFAVQRLLESHSIRAGYASLLIHLITFLALGLVWAERRGNGPVRPLLIRFESPAAMNNQEQFQVFDVEPSFAASDESNSVATSGNPLQEPPTQHDGVASSREVATAPTMDSREMVPPVADSPARVDLAAVDQVTSDPDFVERRPRDSRDAPSRNIRWRVNGGITGPAFDSRRGDARRAAVRSRGGSSASEMAVENGLAWLAAHQAADGSWRCELSGCGCNGACRDRGTVPGTIGATAIALLPFLGAGHTHQEGRWQQTVSAGLYYLLGNMQQTPRGGDLCEGSMYAHGIATLAFTETLGLSKDETFRKASRDAIRFIETSQDPHGGGWRYLPGQPGDTTVTGWQIAALKSGAMAGLEIPSPVTLAAGRFLDRVQSREGAAYGYLSANPKPSTTAVGLLCRMYQGWKVGHEPLDDGIRMLLTRGHDPQAIYTNFYLSQILIQADHSAWPRWNAHNRDILVRMQSQLGHERGSWSFLESETAPGGRLVHTALAILTLEVYYRLLPIYGESAVDAGF